MNLTDLRPLSELYREDQRRLRAREVDVIIPCHRIFHSLHRLANEAAQHPPKERP
jgi:hypothetical protein